MTDQVKRPIINPETRARMTEEDIRRCLRENPSLRRAADYEAQHTYDPVILGEHLVRR